MVVSLPRRWCASASFDKHLENLPLNKPVLDSKLVAALRKLRRRIDVSRLPQVTQWIWASLGYSKTEKEKKKERVLFCFVLRKPELSKEWGMDCQDFKRDGISCMFFLLSNSLLLRKNWSWASLGYSCNTVKAGYIEYHATSGLVSLNQMHTWRRFQKIPTLCYYCHGSFWDVYQIL